MREPSLTKKLQARLNDAGKLVILGVGSDLRGDDVAGIKIASRLARAFAHHPSVHIMLGGTAPENFTGVIRRWQPSHLIVLDATRQGKEAGTVSIVDATSAEGLSCCTHALPLKMMLQYLRQECNMQIVIIGIEPKDTAFGQPISAPVQRAIRRVATAVKSAIALAMPRTELPGQ